jgi:hypothetical protein
MALSHTIPELIDPLFTCSYWAEKMICLDDGTVAAHCNALIRDWTLRDPVAKLLCKWRTIPLCMAEGNDDYMILVITRDWDRFYRQAAPTLFTLNCYELKDSNVSFEAHNSWHLTVPVRDVALLELVPIVSLILEALCFAKDIALVVCDLCADPRQIIERSLRKELVRCGGVVQPCQRVHSLQS